MTNIIIQAGGKGSRLEHYCWNKPKCLVPVDGKPMLYQLLETFEAGKGESHVVSLIAEHKADVLARYLDVFKPVVPVKIVRPEGTGTASGIRQSLAHLADGEPFWIVWSDLVFKAPLVAPTSDKPVVYLSRSFPCRWSAQADESGRLTLVEQRSTESGVMGLFWFPNKAALGGLSNEGEFVRWLSQNVPDFDTLYCDDVTELGTLNALLNHWDSAAGTRFFNKVTYLDDVVVKEAVVPEYAHMIEKEANWYAQVSELGFAHIPRIHSIRPLTLERIKGLHPHQMQWGAKGRRQILENVIESLSELHALKEQPATPGACEEVYLKKTVARIEKIRRLLPVLNEWRAIKINGVWVPNVLHEKEAHLLTDAFKMTRCDRFTAIHGDPTFSNILIDEDKRPHFIDPRGCFAEPGIMGDPNYDWAKLYYSVVGNYDYFNRRQFILSLDSQSADIEIRDGGWSHLKDVLKERLSHKISTVRVLHAFIWLGLSGWVDDDYDSILAAYFNGLYHLHEALEL